MSKVQKIKDLIADTGWSDKQIAKRVKCSIAYVNMVRNGKADKVVKKPKAATGVDAVLDERGSRYGAFAKQAAVGQQLKGIVHVYLKSGDMGYEDYCVVNEALEMICVKMARILNGDPLYADNWVDIAGYAKLVADHLEGKSR